MCAGSSIRARTVSLTSVRWLSGAYTVEVYPTVIRARGSALSAGTTKTGGVLILALVAVAVAAPSIRLSAAIGVLPIAAAFAALIAFGPETRFKQLEQITAEEIRSRPMSPAALD
jgi:MFS transporter, putative metabolite:H+ symporter